jgi:hypothetical protein
MGSFLFDEGLNVFKVRVLSGTQPLEQNHLSGHQFGSRACQTVVGGVPVALGA